ncbi:hypothetical protein MMC22_002626 [Lobaria immixta]|nr:hypothetical protein [Lobaria immixta]
MSHLVPHSETAPTSEEGEAIVDCKASSSRPFEDNLLAPQQVYKQSTALGSALTDTPASTAPSSPRIPPRRQDSVSHNPSRSRPTTLDIPGLTKSKVSPDGRIAQRDVGSKLVIVMVGLPARGKSYITKKITRYLNWLQHDTRIFNVGERRRVAAGAPYLSVQLTNPSDEKSKNETGSRHTTATSLNDIWKHDTHSDIQPAPTTILVNGEPASEPVTHDMLPSPALNPQELEDHYSQPSSAPANSLNVLTNLDTTGNKASLSEIGDPSKAGAMDQSAHFFDPNNTKAAQLREEVAMATLDDLLDYILDQGGSVGIFDATNSTLERRKRIMEKIRQRAGPELGVLFLESLCIDENLLESNMRLKLSGPDYKDQNPVAALDDFKKRVALYEEKYIPLGDYEERNNMPYVQMIDVGRKVVSHQIRGFLSAQTVYYLLNFNLSPRQIWITRHGESFDNVNGKIGGDSELSEVGHLYAKALTRFIKHERKAWDVRQRDKALSTHFPPLPGDTTPPNPEYSSQGDDKGGHDTKSFCVWTSMLKRSVQTAQYFDEEDFDIKQMKMLDELNAGTMEGLTYEEIKIKYLPEYELRKHDKLHYRYPGAGGEGYLDIINRLRAVIVEVERMTDHVLLVGHRSVARVLLAYFKGLQRDDVADLDVPLGMLYMLEPKPYGVDFKAYRYNTKTDWFDHVPNYQLRRQTSH